MVVLFTCIGNWQEKWKEVHTCQRNGKIGKTIQKQDMASYVEIDYIGLHLSYLWANQLELTVIANYTK